MNVFLAEFKDTESIMAAHCASKTVLSMFESIDYQLWCVGFLMQYYIRNQQQYHKQIKEYKRASFNLNLDCDDVYLIYRHTGMLLEQNLMERVKHEYTEDVDAEQCDIDFVNSIVVGIEASALASEDLIEYLKKLDIPEIESYISDFSAFPKKLRDFLNGPLIGALKVLNDEDVLRLKDKTIIVQTVEKEDEGEPLKIEMNTDSIDVEIPFNITTKDAEGKLVKFSTNVQFKEVDHFKGTATGIVMPAGRPDRRYLDGSYFEKGIVEHCMFDFMINVPFMDKDHDEKTRTYYWDNEDFALVENWQCRSPFLLGGQMTEVGDWIMTIFSISDTFKKDLKDGVYNGFSIEVYVDYAPDHILARP